MSTSTDKYLILLIYVFSLGVKEMRSKEMRSKEMRSKEMRRKEIRSSDECSVLVLLFGIV